MQMAVRLWGSKTPGNAQCGRDLTLLKNKKKVCSILLIFIYSLSLIYIFIHYTHFYLNILFLF